MVRVYVHRVSALEDAECRPGRCPVVRTIHGNVALPEALCIREADVVVWSPDAAGYGAAIVRGGLVDEIERYAAHPIVKLLGAAGIRPEVV